MKLIYILSIYLSCFTNCFGQKKVTFKIKEIVVKNNHIEKEEIDFGQKDSIFFEDSDYIVTKTCYGEWGGSIWFKNKKNGIEYSCASTCPVSINKIQNKYIVSNSLAHLYGASHILEIENPKLMSVFKIPEPRKVENGIKHYFFGDTESKSTKGTKIIWSGSEILILISFPYKEKLYHIITKKGKTFLGTIKKNELNIVDEIFDEEIWIPNNKEIINRNGTISFLIKNRNINGYVEITKNKITIFRTK